MKIRRECVCEGGWEAVSCGEGKKENLSKPDMRIEWETYSNIKLLFF